MIACRFEPRPETSTPIFIFFITSSFATEALRREIQRDTGDLKNHIETSNSMRCDKKNVASNSSNYGKLDSVLHHRPKTLFFYVLHSLFSLHDLTDEVRFFAELSRFFHHHVGLLFRHGENHAD